MPNYKRINHKDNEAATDDTIFSVKYEKAELEKEAGTLEGTPPREEYEKITGRTPVDLVFYLINKINVNINALIAAFFAVLLYSIALTTGHLGCKEDFFWVTAAIGVTSSIIFFFNLFKKKK